MLVCNCIGGLKGWGSDGEDCRGYLVRKGVMSVPVLHSDCACKI